MRAKHSGVQVGLAGFALFVVAQAAQAVDLAERKAEIASLQSSEQQELLKKLERFNQLPPAEQDRLRAFQAALEADSDAQRLQTVLERYHAWLKTITPSQRARLAALDPKQRVEEVKKIKRQQERSQRIDVLTKQDMRAVLSWTEEFVWERRKNLLAELPKDQRERFNQMDPQRQRRALLLRAFERSRREGRGDLESLEQDDVDRLALKLSEPAKKALSEAGSLAAERRLVGAWVGTSFYRSEPWTYSRRPSSLVAEDLLQYLQNDVPPSERERLLKMPREQMLEELRGMYFERSRGDFPGRPWFDGKPPGERGKNFRNRQGPPRPPGGPDKPRPDADVPRPDTDVEVPKPTVDAPAASDSPAPAPPAAEPSASKPE